jgi:hypothetical protein
LLGAPVIHVVSTGFRAPTRERCLASVESQQGVEFQHHYCEASEQEPPRNVLANLRSMIEPLKPADIVVWVDGDDWLAHAGVLAGVECRHALGAWVTYGSFRFSDGRPGFAAEYSRDEDIRTSPWRATHLKTFRAGLFQRLRPEDVTWAGGAPVPWDMVVMMGCMEMAGGGRSHFLPEVLYVYNFASSHEWNATPEQRALTRKLEATVRARAPYERVEAL